MTLYDKRLTWPSPVVDFRGIRLQNGFDFLNSVCKIDHKLCVVCPENYFGDISWRNISRPCPVLNTSKTPFEAINERGAFSPYILCDYNVWICAGRVYVYLPA